MAPPSLVAGPAQKREKSTLLIVKEPALVSTQLLFLVYFALPKEKGT